MGAGEMGGQGSEQSQVFCVLTFSSSSVAISNIFMCIRVGGLKLPHATNTTPGLLLLLLLTGPDLLAGLHAHLSLSMGRE